MPWEMSGGTSSKGQERSCFSHPLHHLPGLQLRSGCSISIMNTSLCWHSSYHCVLVIDLNDNDGRVIPHLMGFSIQLHIVKDQQLVPGRAKGLIENLEEWKRDLLLQIRAKAFARAAEQVLDSAAWHHWWAAASLLHGVSPKDSSETKTQQHKETPIIPNIHEAC